MKIFPPHRRGRRLRRPAPLDVSTAISFVLSAQCCFAQILENPNLVTSSGTSHFCETEIEPFSYNVLVNFLPPQNRCRSLRIYVALRDKKSGAGLILRYYFYLVSNFHVLFGFILHRLVGLRLLRLCLKLR